MTNLKKETEKVVDEIIKNIVDWENTHFFDEESRIGAMQKLKFRWRERYGK